MSVAQLSTQKLIYHIFMPEVFDLFPEHLDSDPLARTCGIKLVKSSVDCAIGSSSYGFDRLIISKTT